MHGPEVKTHASSPDTQSASKRPRIVMVTAASISAARQSCLDAGADEILGKPPSRAELQQALLRCRTG